MATLGRPRDRHKEQFWRQTLQRFERSGLSAAQFCRRQQLPPHSFWAWKRTLRLRDQPAQATPPHTAPGPQQPSQLAPLPFFVPLRLPHQDPRGTPGTAADLILEVLLPNGLCLRLPQHFDPAALPRLLTVLGGASC
jgi:hypothetical protein